jgi:hypothetical protein
MTRDRRERAATPAGSNDQDKHGRKQNSGTNETSLRGRGSHREHGYDGADSDPRTPSQQPRRSSTTPE